MPKLTNEQKFMIASSKDTIEKRRYLIDFNKRMKNKIKTRNSDDHYTAGIKENPLFWNDIYDDTHIPENGMMHNIKPKIGTKYQANIPEIKY